MTTLKKLLQWFKRIWAVVSGERSIARNHDTATKTRVASGFPVDRDGGSRTPTTSRPTVFETAASTIPPRPRSTPVFYMVAVAEARRAPRGAPIPALGRHG